MKRLLKINEHSNVIEKSQLYLVKKSTPTFYHLYNDIIIKMKLRITCSISMYFK